MRNAAAAPVGTIFYTSWGYDQTNVDFYEVVSATTKMVTVAKIYAYYDDERYLYPRPGAFVAPIERIKRLCKVDGQGRHFICLESWGLYAWEHTPNEKHADTYTWGGAGH